MDPATLQNFANAIRVSFNGMGIRVPSDLPAFLQGNIQGNVATMIAEVMSKAKGTFGSTPDIIFFLLHGANIPVYKAVKDCCDVQFGVASQGKLLDSLDLAHQILISAVMLVEKALSERGQQQYLGNIGLKVNVKLGCLNHVVHEPAFQRSRWMMMGADTSHPSPAQLRMNPPPPAYTAIVATWDKACAQYTSVVSAQEAKEQLIGGITDMFKEHFARYQEKNQGALPESIIYYRDGLSEGQFQQIIETEAKPLKGELLIPRRAG